LGPFEWDEVKRRTNLDKHGADFRWAEDFDWDRALTRQDVRKNYGEERFVSIGPIHGRLFVAVWNRRGGRCRLISLRKANAREERHFEQATDVYR
jgi:uncharacterized DUF497 family protein